MKVAVIYQAGGPENFILEERPTRLPQEDWVLFKVKAFGLNRSELMTRKGYSPNVKFPRVLGIGCVGEVEQDPSGEFKPGQKVAAFMGIWVGILMVAMRNMRCYLNHCFTNDASIFCLEMNSLVEAVKGKSL